MGLSKQNKLYYFGDEDLLFNLYYNILQFVKLLSEAHGTGKKCSLHILIVTRLSLEIGEVSLGFCLYHYWRILSTMYVIIKVF